MARILSQLSGGYDSVAVIIKLLEEGHQVKGIFFDYCQKYYYEEIQAVQYINEFLENKYYNYLGTVQKTVNMELQASGTNSVSDYIPIRNLVFGTISANYAIANEFSKIAVGNKTTIIREDDPYCFKDCSVSFYKKLEDLVNFASEDDNTPEFIMPLTKSSTESFTKGEVVKIIYDAGVDFNRIWSCYEPGELPCGECYHCIENKEAFREAGIEDPVIYKKGTKHDNR